MREFKLRWYDPGNEVMHLTGLDSTGWSIMGDVIIPDYHKGINGWQIMQYTGLKDKNGVEIYEGDILAHEGKSHKTLYLIVEWPTYKAQFKRQKSGRLHQFNQVKTRPKNFEVVGNIYENPEIEVS